MISIYCQRLHVVLWLSGLKHMSSKQEIPGSNPAVPHFQIILWFIIMFTLFVFLNDFHPLSDIESGSVA